MLGLLAAYVVVAGPAGPAGGYNRADDRQCALVTSHICILTKKCQNELFFYHLVEKLLSSKIIINYTEDFGPITKILGLKYCNININTNDKIIIVDDDWIYSKYLTYFYNLCYPF